MKIIMFTAALALGTVATAQTTQAPGNTAPELDARGVPVVSDPATAPAGWNQPATMVPAGTPPPSPPAATVPTSSTGPLPPCSKTVTDRCTQTYERGVRG